MTQLPDQTPSLEVPEKPQVGKITDVELASYLRRLAALYKLPATGNPSLSEALNELASWVSTRAPVSRMSSKSRKKTSREEPSLDLLQLKAFTKEQVEKFITDERKTKIELIDLANARFSFPRSQLKRLKTSEVRETIKAAALHEDSIEIISQEARRNGSNRSS